MRKGDETIIIQNWAKYIEDWIENESKPNTIFGLLRVPPLILKDQKENIICTMDDVREDF